MSSECRCHESYCEMYSLLEERYKLALSTLERFDDRKNPILPRNEMARIAKKTLDVLKTLENHNKI